MCVCVWFLPLLPLIDSKPVDEEVVLKEGKDTVSISSVVNVVFSYALTQRNHQCSILYNSANKAFMQGDFCFKIRSSRKVDLANC